MSSPPSEGSFTELYQKKFHDDGAEEDEVVSVTCSLALNAMQHVTESPPSPILAREYIMRDRISANERLMKDYFDPIPVHGPEVLGSDFA